MLFCKIKGEDICALTCYDLLHSTERNGEQLFGIMQRHRVEGVFRLDKFEYSLLDYYVRMIRPAWFKLGLRKQLLHSYDVGEEMKDYSPALVLNSSGSSALNASNVVKQFKKRVWRMACDLALLFPEPEYNENTHIRTETAMCSAAVIASDRQTPPRVKESLIPVARRHREKIRFKVRLV